MPKNGHTVEEEMHVTFNNADNQNGRIAFVGLAGSGKSTVLANYLQKYQCEYSAVVLINAENNDTMIQSFKEVASILDERPEYWQEQLKLLKTEDRVAKRLLNLVNREYHKNEKNILVVFENVPKEPQDNWRHVLEWTASTAHTLLSSRDPVAIASANKTRSITMPHELTKDEFHKVVTTHLRDCDRVKKLDEGSLDRIYKLTAGLPKCVELVIGEIKKDDDPERVPRVIDEYEGKLAQGEDIFELFGFTIDRLDDQARDTLLSLAHFEPDHLPESLVEATAAEVVDKAPESDTVYTVLRRLKKGTLLKCDTTNNCRIHRLVHSAARARHKEPGGNFFCWLRAWWGGSGSGNSSFSRANRAIHEVWGREFRYSDVDTWPMTRQLMPHLRQCLSHHRPARQLSREDKAVVAHNYFNLGMYGFKLIASFEEALKHYKEALAIYQATVGQRHPDTAKTYDKIGVMYHKKGDNDKALGHHQQALAIFQDIWGEKQHPEAARTHNNLGIIYAEKYDTDKALEHYKQALAIYQATVSENHPDPALHAHVHSNMGVIYRQKGDNDKALEHCKEALAIYQTSVGERHPDTAHAYNNIGNIYAKTKDNDKALEQYKKVLKIYQDTVGEKHPFTARAYNNMGVIYRRKDDDDKALECYKEALTIYHATESEDHPSAAGVHSNMGVIYGENNDSDKALEHYKKALSIYQATVGENHPYTALVRSNMAMISRQKVDKDGGPE